MDNYKEQELFKATTETDKKTRATINSGILQRIKHEILIKSEKTIGTKEMITNVLPEYEKTLYNWKAGTTIPIYPIMLLIEHYKLSADKIFNTDYERAKEENAREQESIFRTIMSITNNQEIGDKEKLKMINTLAESGKKAYSNQSVKDN